MSDKARQFWEQKLLRQSKRGLLRIVFSRTVITILLLFLNIFLMFSLLFELFEGIVPIYGGLTVATAVTLIFILNSGEDPSFQLSWCVLVAVLPLFGIVLYTVVRMDLGSRLYKRMVAKSVRTSLPYLPDAPDIPPEEPVSGIAHYLHSHANAPLYTATQVQYFPLGEDKFKEMLIRLEQAEHFIFLEYFIVCPGIMWGQILDVLCRKAKQGVEVRVLYDGMNAITNLPHSYPRQLEKLGIKCKMFSPLRPLVSTHYNNRDHRKILVIDGHTAFTGGINLQDRYINEDPVLGHWKDTAIMMEGEAARGFTLLFLQMWNANEREAVYAPYLPEHCGRPGEGCVIPYGEDPTGSERVAKTVYLSILNQARDYVYIMTPYLVLDREMSNALRFAAKRGVDVRIVLPHIPDKRTVFAVTRSHYQELIAAGVQIYEYTPGFVHGKVFLSDDVSAVVGSINLDYRSLYLHYECAAYLYKVPALRDIKADFADTMGRSRLVTMTDVRRRSPFSRATAALLKVAAPLL